MSKISELSDGGVIQGGDTLIAVRSGGNVKVTYGGSTTANIDGGTIDGTVIGGSTAAAGSFTTISASGEIAANGGVAFGDNDKATFGASDDLQIYHDGSNSYVNDQGTGDLILRASTGIKLQSASGVVEFLSTNSGTGALTLATTTFTGGITATGIDVTGTVTADGLTVANTSVIAGDFSGGTAATYIRVQDPTDNWFYGSNVSLGGFLFKNETADVNRFMIGSNGDLFGYNATGTAKFFWDASAESLGIGTTSPSAKLDVTQSSSGSVVTGLMLRNPNSSSVGTGTKIYFSCVDANNRGSYIESAAGASNATYLAFATNGVGADATERLRLTSTGACEWRPDGTTQAMTLDSSGNLLVAGTSTTPWANATGTAADNQFIFREDGILGATAYKSTTDVGYVGYFNRTATDGGILAFHKDGALVGSIGVVSSNNLYIANPTDGIGLGIGDDNLYPTNGTGTAYDNNIDIGDASVRFQDIYATNGTIQTSDRNEKQDIEELSEAEQRVAVAAKGLLRKFRWKSKVEEKGDDARIHFGIIAQDLQAAFEAEGLDAGRYAMFISSTWTDEETGEERSRMGVRYSELLAFIIAAI